MTAKILDARARTWAEVDLEQVGRNVHALRALLGRAGPPASETPASETPASETLAVVKADAYGHGAAVVARACARAGVLHFGVASLAEAAELRRAGVPGDIYLFSPFLPAEAEAVIRIDAIPFVSSPEQWDALAAASVSAPLPARCFLKVDTGMGRSGCFPEEARTLWDRAPGAPNLRITGIVTHFSSADEPDPSPTEAQRERFTGFLRALLALGEGDDGRGGRGVWLSLANSPAALRFPPPPALPGVRGVLVRAGLLLYGIEPFRGALDGTDLRPILAWRARVTLLRDLPAGQAVGYGRTCTLARPSRVATLAAGYADGLPRRLSNAGHVLLRGRRCPILGRVSMDQCQIDVTDLPEATLGDAATIIGTDGQIAQTVLDIAEQIDTTPHEPTCALSRRVPRIYV